MGSMALSILFHNKEWTNRFDIMVSLVGKMVRMQMA